MYSKGANNMAVSGLSCREALIGTGRAISVLFGISGLRNKPLTFVGLQFPMFKAYGDTLNGSRKAVGKDFLYDSGKNFCSLYCKYWRLGY